MRSYKQHLSDVLTALRDWKTVVIAALILWHFVIAGLLTHTFKILPESAERLTELYIAIFAVTVVVWRIVKRKPINWISNHRLFSIIPLGFLVLVSISAIINSVPFRPFFEQVVWYFRFYVLAFTIVNLDLNKNSIKALSLLILAVIILQIPVTLIQCALWTLGDWSVGTLTASATTDLAFLSCLGALLIFFMHLYNKISNWHLILVPLLVIPIICGNNQMGILLMPFSLIIASLVSLPTSLKALGWITIFSIGLFAILLLILPFFRKSTLRYFEIYDTAVNNQFVSSPDSLSRMRAPAVAYENISHNWQTLLFGYGFGSIRSRQFGHESVNGMDNRLLWQNQISTSLVETGIMGLTYVFILPFLIMVYVYIGLNRATEFQRFLLLIFLSITLLFLIGLIYTQVLGSNHFSFIFWTLFTFTWILSRSFPKQKFQ